jgi:hypothetical protein
VLAAAAATVEVFRNLRRSCVLDMEMTPAIARWKEWPLL